MGLEPLSLPLSCAIKEFVCQSSSLPGLLHTHITLALSWHKGWNEVLQHFDIEVEWESKKMKMPIQNFSRKDFREPGHRTSIANNIIVSSPSIFGICLTDNTFLRLVHSPLSTPAIPLVSFDSNVFECWKSNNFGCLFRWSIMKGYCNPGKEIRKKRSALCFL